MLWHTYIIRCRDKKLYTGITNDLKRRLAEHNSGDGCKFTRCRIPVKLLCSIKSKTRSGALKKEAAIKGLTREQKLGFIKNLI